LTKLDIVLLKEKFKLEKKRDEIFLGFFNLFLIENEGGSQRKSLLGEYKATTEELKVIQQRLDQKFEV
jgi:hypothetical protein